MNWYLILSGTSYFDQFQRPPLLRHLWSLAVEEQFYLLWPLALAGLLMLFRKRPRPAVHHHAGARARLDRADGAALRPGRPVARLLRDRHPHRRPDARLLPGALLAPAAAAGGRPAGEAQQRSAAAGVLGLVGLAAPRASSAPSAAPSSTAAASSWWTWRRSPSSPPWPTRPCASGAGSASRCSSTSACARTASTSGTGRSSPSPARRGPRPGPGLVFVIRLVITFVLADLSYRLIETPIRSGAIGRWMTGWRASRGAERRPQEPPACSASASARRASLLLADRSGRQRQAEARTTSRRACGPGRPPSPTQSTVATQRRRDDRVGRQRAGDRGRRPRRGDRPSPRRGDAGGWARCPRSRPRPPSCCRPSPSSPSVTRSCSAPRRSSSTRSEATPTSTPSSDGSTSRPRRTSSGALKDQGRSGQAVVLHLGNNGPMSAETFRRVMDAAGQRAQGRRRQRPGDQAVGARGQPGAGRAGADVPERPPARLVGRERHARRLVLQRQDPPEPGRCDRLRAPRDRRVGGAPAQPAPRPRRRPRAGRRRGPAASGRRDDRGPRRDHHGDRARLPDGGAVPWIEGAQGDGPGPAGPTLRPMPEPVRVAVTGAAGQIGYSLLFRIASGAMLGPDQPVDPAAARDHARRSRRSRASRWSSTTAPSRCSPTSS